MFIQSSCISLHFRRYSCIAYYTCEHGVNVIGVCYNEVVFYVSNETPILVFFGSAFRSDWKRGNGKRETVEKWRWKTRDWKTLDWKTREHPLWEIRKSKCTYLSASGLCVWVHAVYLSFRVFAFYSAAVTLFKVNSLSSSQFILSFLSLLGLIFRNWVLRIHTL